MALQDANRDWQTNIERARQLMSVSDQTNLMDDRNALERQISVVETLQNLAFHDADAGGISDMADWCLRSWLRILSHHPQEVRVLSAIGRWWLARAQPLLARIAVHDNTSSSGSSHSPTRTLASRARTTASSEERQADRAAHEAEARMHLPDYVEARGVLLPATEYLRQAVAAATEQRILTGDLLLAAAEAYMSLGNVSYARVGEGIFEHAVLYLRAASNISGFTLPRHLRRWLDDYGRFVS
ncbi:hypothetical protein NA57DRAFT_74843 [Rhizodiscina lignyota]|uniref:Uncharacterized protein n=1 Tax=Rhizodiscina lignyota TaxID=1504668 RepID=A0A9P4M9G6_9PEZI|nr:hypothetical protein NA57DRAFT_74843 [Rhizodiscina lignyota]